MFCYPTVLPADLAIVRVAHELAQALPSVDPSSSTIPTEEHPNVACWGLLAVMLVLDERKRSGAAAPCRSSADVGSERPKGGRLNSPAGKGVAAEQAPIPFQDPEHFGVDAKSSHELSAEIIDNDDDVPRPFQLSGAHPFEIAELRELILGHVPVDVNFSASALRVNRDFCHFFQPRLYRSINLTGPVRQPIKFLESLELRSTKELNPEDIQADAKHLADVVAACPGLGRLNLKKYVSIDFYNAFFDRLLAYHPAAVVKRLEELVIELPAETFFLRDRDALPAPPKVKTIRTLCDPPATMAPELSIDVPQPSVRLLTTLVGYLDGQPAEAKTLVIGSGLMAYLDSESPSSANRLEVALAERLTKDCGAELGCRVLWPKALDLGALLERDLVFAAIGLMETIELWRQYLWPEMSVTPHVHVQDLNIQGPLLPPPSSSPMTVVD